MLPKFEQFIRGRQYITNVSASTVEWYKQSLAWAESPTEADIKTVVMGMRDKGLKPTGCNCRLRAIKAYVRWAGLDTPVPKLKEPQQELPTFDSKDIARLMSWRPKSIPQHRSHLLISFLLDIGARIDEAVSLRWVTGKYSGPYRRVNSHIINVSFVGDVVLLNTGAVFWSLICITNSATASLRKLLRQVRRSSWQISPSDFTLSFP